MKQPKTRKVQQWTMSLGILLATTAPGCSREDTTAPQAGVDVSGTDQIQATDEPAAEFTDTLGTKWQVERPRLGLTDSGGGDTSARVFGAMGSSSPTGPAMQFTVLSMASSVFESGAAPKTFIISANPLTVDGIQVRMHAGPGAAGRMLDAGTVTISTDPGGLVHVTINAEAPLDGVSYAARSSLTCSSVNSTATSKGAGSIPIDPGLDTPFCQKFRFLL